MLVGVVVALLFAPTAWSATTKTGESRLETQVIFLQAMPAVRAKALYRAVIGVDIAGGAQVTVTPHGHTITIRDSAPHLARFRALMDVLDQAEAMPLRVFVRRLEHLDPGRFAKTVVRQIIQPEGVPLRLVADPRSGVLVVATTLALYREVDALARRLDQPVQPLPAPFAPPEEAP